MDSSFSSHSFVNQVGVDLIGDFKKARRATTPTLVGGAIEQATRNAFKRLLSHGLEIGSGCVIDSYGRTSRQMDIVIYESLAPVFCINDHPETTYYPYEGLVSVGEIKSKVGVKELEDALAKTDSIKSLKAHFEPTTYSRNRRGQDTITPVTPYRHYNEMKRDTWKAPFDPAAHPDSDALVFVLTDTLTVSRERLLCIYEEAFPKIPDFTVSMDGTMYIPCLRKPSGGCLVEPARTADHVAVVVSEHPFSRLVVEICRRLTFGRTPNLSEYEHYYVESSRQDEVSYARRVATQSESIGLQRPSSGLHYSKS